MLIKNHFFKNFYLKSKKFNKNLIKTKKAFQYIEKNLLDCPELRIHHEISRTELDFYPPQIKKFSKYKNIVVIGMGGSVLGTKSIYSYLKKKIKKKFFFFDNLDENLHVEFEKIKNLKNTGFIAVSKSGNTLETITNLNVIMSKINIKNKLAIITDRENTASKDNILASLAEKNNIDIFINHSQVGGRYSVLSETGMFPAALMGLKIYQFKNLKKLIKNKIFVSSLILNVASIFTLYKKNFKNSIILNYNSNLNDLGFWYQQLTSESLGKNGNGINPVLSTNPKDNHSLLQLYLDGPKDKFFTFFDSITKNKKINSIIQAQSKATKNVFIKEKIPFRQFFFNKLNEEEMGMFFTFTVLETILLSRLIKINPFDQPAVEQVKIETQKILS